jgi:hypothetical protein
MTLSSPAPATAKVKVAGRMPMAVAIAKARSLTPNSAAARLVSQNGMMGRRRRNSRYENASWWNPLARLWSRGPALRTSTSPNEVRAMRKTSTAPIVAQVAATAPPSSQPNRNPARMVRNTDPGTESATTVT